MAKSYGTSFLYTTDITSYHLQITNRLYVLYAVCFH